MTDGGDLPEGITEKAQAKIREIQELYTPHQTRGKDLDRVKHLVRSLVKKDEISVTRTARLIGVGRQTVDRWLEGEGVRVGGPTGKAKLSPQEKKRAREGDVEEVVETRAEEEIAAWMIADEARDINDLYRNRMAFGRRLENEFPMVLAREGGNFSEFVVGCIHFYEEKADVLLEQNEILSKTNELLLVKLDEARAKVDELAAELFTNNIKLQEYRELLKPDTKLTRRT